MANYSGEHERHLGHEPRDNFPLFGDLIVRALDGNDIRNGVGRAMSDASFDRSLELFNQYQKTVLSDGEDDRQRQLNDRAKTTTPTMSSTTRDPRLLQQRQVAAMATSTPTSVQPTTSSVATTSRTTSTTTSVRPTTPSVAATSRTTSKTSKISLTRDTTVVKKGSTRGGRSTDGAVAQRSPTEANSPNGATIDSAMRKVVDNEPVAHFDASSIETPRTFHDFVQLLTTYDRLNREDRSCVTASIIATFSPAERALCEGSVARRPVRDIVRAFCYGVRDNVEWLRESTKNFFNELGFFGPSFDNITDAMLVKHMDRWYDFASSTECKYKKNLVLPEEVRSMMNFNRPIKGRACRACVNAIVRLSRTGLCNELARANTDSKFTSMDDAAANGGDGASATATKQRSAKAERKTGNLETSTPQASRRTPSSSTTTTTSRKRKMSTVNATRKEGDATTSKNVTKMTMAAKKVKTNDRAAVAHESDVSVAAQLSMPKLSDDEPFLQVFQQRSTIHSPRDAVSDNTATIVPSIVQTRSVPVAKKNIDKNYSPESPMGYTDDDYTDDSCESNDNMDDNNEAKN